MESPVAFRGFRLEEGSASQYATSASVPAQHEAQRRQPDPDRPIRVPGHWRLSLQLWRLWRLRGNVVTYGSAMGVVVPPHGDMPCSSCPQHGRPLSRIPARCQRNVVMFNTAITLSQGWSLALLVTHSMRHWAGMGGTQACSNESMAKLADDQDSVSWMTFSESGWYLAEAVGVSLGELQTRPDLLSFNSLIHAAADSAAWPLALQVLQCAGALGQRLSVVSHNSAIHATSGPWRWAHHLLAKLAKIPGIEADLISCNSLLGGCPWDMALHDLGMMSSCFNLQPSIMSHNKCLEAEARDSQWQRAFPAGRFRGSAEPLANVVTWNSSVSACETGTQWLTAAFLLLCMRLQRCNPELESISMGISACREAGHWEVAMALLHSVTADVVAFNSNISTFEVLGNWTCSLQMLEQMPHRNLVPDVITFNASIASLPWPSWPWAVQLIQQMRFPRPGRAPPKPNLVSYNTALNACAQGQAPFSILLTLFAASRAEGGPDSFSYNSVVERCDAWHSALDVVAEMSQNLVRPSLVCQQTLLRKCSWARQWSSAIAGLASNWASVSWGLAVEACEKCSKPFLWR
ncbi:unnamed protein product [Cladocopium goreaui]|uniref:Pentacotripeptide-repeat region of PRORP domain-containing protein n=1 Tax=Cladocopium goreaui TaxID=2562237 RepID=A0A9P1CBM0_9DINO|nr:unnamed protein product [Cladocopium goreaui]